MEEDIKMEENKSLEAIPIETFRILIYKVAIEDFIKERWDGLKLKIDKYDKFYDNIDKESFCKALACTVYAHKDEDSIAFFNRVWAKKMVNMGAPKNEEFVANVPSAALEQLVTDVRKRFSW
jgi:hypothetical protein